MFPKNFSRHCTMQRNAFEHNLQNQDKMVHIDSMIVFYYDNCKYYMYKFNFRRLYIYMNVFPHEICLTLQKQVHCIISYLLTQLHLLKHSMTILFILFMLNHFLSTLYQYCVFSSLHVCFSLQFVIKNQIVLKMLSQSKPCIDCSSMNTSLFKSR